MPHASAVERLVHSNDGAELVTVDAAGAIASWPLALASAGLGRPLGRTIAAGSLSASADGRRLAFTREDGAVAVVDAIAGAELYRLRLPRSAPATWTQLAADGGELVTQSGVELKRWSLPSKAVTPRAPTVDALPTALALDRGIGVLAVGLASGQLQIALAAAPTARPALSFFGHRGAITAAAVIGSRDLAATGGHDGIVRLWDAAASVPTGAVAQPADAPVAIVALSADGRYVASAAASVVRAASVADGRVTTELRVGGAVTALELSPDAARLAIGDATGAVTIAALAAGELERADVPLGTAVTSLAFAPNGERVAVADAAGAVTLVATDGGQVERTVRPWSQPIRWLEFSPDGSALLVATDAWLHALAPTLEPVHSKLAVWPASSTVWSAASGTRVSFFGVDAAASLVSGEIDLAAASIASADVSVLVERDWATALGLRLNDNGDPTPFDP
jgi:WD40 repeat protein